MSDSTVYNCETCGKKVELTGQVREIPECCEMKMKPEPLPFCETTATAEHSRLDDLGEPCDDSRKGR